MKKLICILSVLTFLCISCSSDDDSEAQANFLPKRAVSTSAGDTPRTFNYFYVGNKLVKMTPSSDIIVENTYTGNLITHVKQYYTNGTVLTETFHEYDSQQRMVVLKVLIYMGQDMGSKTIYTYNSDNTVSYQEFLGSITSQNTPGSSGKMWLSSNGQVLQDEVYLNGALSRKVINTYDDKNGLFKNALGFEKWYGGENTMTHNTLSSTTYDGNGVVLYGNTSQYTYNEYNYPISVITETLGSNSPSNVQYFYE